PGIYTAGGVQLANTAACINIEDSTMYSMIPCIDPTPLASPVPTNKLAALPTTKSASCQKLFDNHKANVYPADPTLTYATFLSSKCKLADEQLRISQVGVATYDAHKIYVCPWEHA